MKRWFSLADQIVVSGGNFMTIVIGAHILSPLEQGKLGYSYSAYIAAAVLNLSIIFLWASVQAPKHDDKKFYLSSLAALQTVVGLLFGAFMAVVYFFFMKFFGWTLGVDEAVALFFFLLILQFSDFIRRSAYIFESPKNAFISSLLHYPIRIGLLIFLAPETAREVILIAALCGILPVVFKAGIIYSMFEAMASSGRALLSSALKHLKGTVWLVLGGSTAWIWGYMPAFFLGRYSGVEAVGFYISIQTLSNVGNILMELLETTVSAKAGRLRAEHRENFYPYLKDILFKGLLLWVLVFLVLVFGAPYLIDLILGAKYAEYSSVILILWVAHGICFMMRLDAIRLRTEGRVAKTSLAAAFACITVAICGWPLVSYLEMNGAALLFTVGSVTALFVQRSSFLKRSIPKEV